jgi:hypothetical protein
MIAKQHQHSPRRETYESTRYKIALSDTATVAMATRAQITTRLRVRDWVLDITDELSTRRDGFDRYDRAAERTRSIRRVMRTRTDKQPARACPRLTEEI